MNRWQEIRKRLDTFRHWSMTAMNTVVVALMGLDYGGMLSAIPQLQPWLSPGVYGKVLAIVTFANFLFHVVLKPRRND
jgi:hypothetical protein